MTRPSDGDGALDLGALEISPGEARTVEVAVPVQPVGIAGNDYRLSVAGGHVSVEITHTHSGWHLRARGAGTLDGPCWRCLTDASVPLTADLTEFGAFDRRGAGVCAGILDPGSPAGHTWVAAGRAGAAPPDDPPATILCRADCRGLCPMCGIDLNTGSCTCTPVTGDPRWEALRGLADRIDEG